MLTELESLLLEMRLTLTARVVFKVVLFLIG